MAHSPRSTRPEATARLLSKPVAKRTAKLGQTKAAEETAARLKTPTKSSPAPTAKKLLAPQIKSTPELAIVTVAPAKTKHSVKVATKTKQPRDTAATAMPNGNAGPKSSAQRPSQASQLAGKKPAGKAQTTLKSANILTKKAKIFPVTKSKAPVAKASPKTAAAKAPGTVASEPAAENIRPEKLVISPGTDESASAPANPLPTALLKPTLSPAAPPVGPRPSIIVAAPPNMPIRNTGNPNSPRAPMGRPNMPPSFAVRSPGRPGFAEGQTTPPRPPGPKIEFKAGDHVVYPTHGVGTVQGIEVIEVAGTDHHMIVVTFEENRMTLRVPVNKVPTAGLRKLFTQKEFEAAIDTLKGRARIKRTMWSRRAQEYEAKINSGDPIQIAEVVRDLQRNAGQPDQSFSERQIYEQALERLAAEFAAIEKIDKLSASDQLVVFAKST